MSAALLLYKESRLVVPPAYLGFAALTLFNLIPHYPLFLGITYFLLGLFIALTEANANKDHEFTIQLPIARDRVVLGKHLIVATVELVQLGALAIVAAVAAQLHPQGNVVGMDPNPAFFGFVLACLGLFNVLFLPAYFKTGYRVGRPGVVAAVAFFLSYGLLELLVVLIPGVSAVVDTLDPAMLVPQLLVLIGGILLYVGLSRLSYVRSARRFAQVNL